MESSVWCRSRDVGGWRRGKTFRVRKEAASVCLVRGKEFRNIQIRKIL